MKNVLFTLLLTITSCYVASAQPAIDWAVNIGVSGDTDIGNALVLDSTNNVYTCGNIIGFRYAYIAKHDNQGNELWLKMFGDGLAVMTATAIAIDTSGNLYVTGRFVCSVGVDFDPDSTTYTLTSNGQSDIFISKFDNNGNWQWARTIGGSSYDEGLAIAVDRSGNVYTTGNFENTADFDPGVNTYYLSSPGINKKDIFLCKLNTNGDFIWAKNIGGSLHESGTCILIDDENNIYFGGGNSSSNYDFDPGPGVYNVPPPTKGGFISKFDSSGNFINVCFHSIRIQSFAFDHSKNIYSTGHFFNTADFDPGPGTYMLSSTNPSTLDVYVCKTDSNYVFQWAVNIGGHDEDQSRSIAISNSGSIYITGVCGDTIDFDPGISVYNLISPGSINGYVCRLDTNGLFKFAFKIESPINVYGNAIACGTNEDILLTGSFRPCIDFDPTIGTYTLCTNGADDAFIAKYNMLTTSIDESVLINKEITVYPNPANHQVSVNLKEPISHVIINLYNTKGQMIYMDEYSDPSNIVLNIDNLPKGLYLMRLTSNIGVYSKSFLKE